MTAKTLTAIPVELFTEADAPAAPLAINDRVLRVGEPTGPIGRVRELREDVEGVTWAHVSFASLAPLWVPADSVERFPTAATLLEPASQIATPEQQAHLDRLPKSFRTVKEAADRNGWKSAARARVTEYGEEVVNMKVTRLGTVISLTFVARNPGDAYRLRYTHIKLAGLELRSNLTEALTRIARPVPA